MVAENSGGGGACAPIGVLGAVVSFVLRPCLCGALPFGHRLFCLALKQLVGVALALPSVAVSFFEKFCVGDPP